MKYDGVCSRCATPLPRATLAVWERSTNSIHCVECPGSAVNPPERPDAQDEIDRGVGGGSARALHDRLAAKREADLKARWGERVGGWITKLGDEPATTRAWAKGAVGEERLGAILDGLPDIHVLHDRHVPGKAWNIDHMVVSGAGIFVIDAKNYRGEVRIRRRGSFFRPEDRLWVGRRDCTKDVDGMGRQLEAVEAALRKAAIKPVPLVIPVLCFIDADWPLFGAASLFHDVRLESERSIRKVVTGPHTLPDSVVERSYGVIAAALPAKAAVAVAPRSI